MNNHIWIDVFTNDWGSNGGRAYTKYVCKACKAEFTHYYHDYSYAECLKKSGVPEECPIILNKKENE